MIGMDAGTDDTTVYRKTGAGAFELSVVNGGKVMAHREGGSTLEFRNARAAYDFYRQTHAIAGDHASWNICYHLEDHLPKE